MLAVPSSSLERGLTESSSCPRVTLGDVHSSVNKRVIRTAADPWQTRGAWGYLSSPEAGEGRKVPAFWTDLPIADTLHEASLGSPSHSLVRSAGALAGRQKSSARRRIYPACCEHGPHVFSHLLDIPSAFRRSIPCVLPSAPDAEAQRIDWAAIRATAMDSDLLGGYRP